MNNTNVAEVIAEQLGGINKLVAMAGARQFLAGDKSLQFKIGRNAKKVTAIIVTLDADDTYTVAFYRGMTKAWEDSMVYADSLRRTVEMHTGLYLSL